MNLQKIHWKAFFQNPAEAHPDDFFKIFNTWIPDSPEIFVDVADYQHVHDGPVTFLAGHYVDYALDDTDSRRGFLYARKQPMVGTNAAKIEESFKAFVTSCQRLVADPLFEGKLSFKTDESLFIVNDRATAPNTAETFQAILPDLEKYFSKILGVGQFTLHHRADPKQRFSVVISSKKPLNMALIG
ncbi:MAG: hypothetical protein Q7T11_05130 [Deltaproteobacteria bacterium]|nr:hypothetical protein [Deltaproteobacteria bacterium]